MKKYPCIIAYCRWMGSYQYWINDQIQKARDCNAPEDTYSIDKGIPSRLSELPKDSLTANYFHSNHIDLYEKYLK